MTTQYDDDDEIVKDGQSVRVPLLQMDSVQRAVSTSVGALCHDGMGNPAGFKPGYVFGPDDHAKRRASAYMAYEQRLSDAWRHR